jgi:hypothetical protein
MTESAHVFWVVVMAVTSGGRFVGRLRKSAIRTVTTAYIVSFRAEYALPSAPAPAEGRSHSLGARCIG